MRALWLTLALCAATGACAINYVFDEYLFSKAAWEQWKMDNPLAELNPSDLLPRVKENYPGYQDAEYNTLDGLFRRKPPSPKAS